VIPGIAKNPKTCGNVRLKCTPKQSQEHHVIGNAAAASRTFIVSKHHEIQILFLWFPKVLNDHHMIVRRTSFFGFLE
jgi:hypothetical protein